MTNKLAAPVDQDRRYLIGITALAGAVSQLGLWDGIAQAAPVVAASGAWPALRRSMRGISASAMRTWGREAARR